MRYLFMCLLAYLCVYLSRWPFFYLSTGVFVCSFVKVTVLMPLNGLFLCLFVGIYFCVYLWKWMGVTYTHSTQQA